MRHPFARHAERPPQGISCAQALALRTTSDLRMSTRPVRLLPDHNSQYQYGGAIRILRSNIFSSGPPLGILIEKALLLVRFCREEGPEEDSQEWLSYAWEYVIGQQRSDPKLTP
jgi:hypothetical protein